MARCVSVYLGKGTEARLKQLAAAENKSLSAYLREQLEALLNEKKRKTLTQDVMPQVVKVLNERDNRMISLLSRVALESSANRNFLVRALIRLGLPRGEAEVMNDEGYKAAVVSLKTKNKDLQDIVAAIAELDDAREASKLIARVQSAARRASAERGQE